MSSKALLFLPLSLSKYMFETRFDVNLATLEFMELKLT